MQALARRARGDGLVTVLSTLAALVLTAGCSRDVIDHHSGDGGARDSVFDTRGDSGPAADLPSADATDDTVLPDAPSTPGWSRVTTGETQPLYGVFGAGNRLFAVGAQGVILEREAGIWSTLASGVNQDLKAMWGPPGSLDDLWVAGQPILRYQSGSFVAVTALPKSAVNALWGSSASDIWAAGHIGVVGHYDGAKWQEVDYLGGSLHAVWGSSATDVWMVGAAGLIARGAGAGSSFQKIDSGLGVIENLWGVWGSSATDVWIVGDKGTILHFDGTWSQATSPTSDRLRAIWGSGASDVWAVGTQGAIVHYDGQSWSGVSSPTSEDLYAVWGVSAGEIWAVGSSGTALRYRP